MIIARQKRNENIVEYILYLWQLEDLIRAYKFDMAVINREIVSRFTATDEERMEIYAWYEQMVTAMREEKITGHGHLQILVSLIADLDDFHFRLIESPMHSDYQKLYQDSVHNITDFRLKMNNRDRITDIEVSLTVLYGFMLMKMKKRPVSDDTQQAIETIRRMIALLSDKYKDFEAGLLEL